MELQVLKTLIKKYSGSAICVSDESTQQILFYNDLCTEFCSEVSEGMLIDDLFEAFAMNYEVVTRNEMTYFNENNNDLFSDQFFVSDSKLTLDDGRQICIHIFHRVNYMFSYREFVNSVTSKALLRDCDMSIIVNLVKDEYYITYEREHESDELFGTIEHKWSSIVNSYLDEFVLPDSAESFKENMATETLKKDFESGMKFKNCVFDYSIDGEKVSKKAMFDFIEYNGVPVVCIRFYTV